MSDMEGEITTLTPAKTKSVSLRTTLPRGIVKQFNLRDGDKISWKLRAENGEIIIVVRPMKDLQRKVKIEQVE